MQTTSPPFWLMIVSIAIAVLPVWRSPMISSRWPRPIGIIESIAFSPVCIGSLTPWRATTPGALNSTGRVWVESIGPLPSSGLPSGSTIRPSIPSPTGMSSSWSVRLTVSPSTTFSQSPNSTVPTSVRSAWPAPRPSMRLLRMDVISSGLICMLGSSGGLGHVLFQVFETGVDRCVEDRVADAHNEATDDLGVDLGRDLDAAPGLGADLIGDVPDGLVVEFDRGGDRHRQKLVGVLPQRVVRAADTEDRRHP